jgi:hypothetical protein
MGELEFISGRRGASGEDIVKSTLFCKVHYVLYSDIKKQIILQICGERFVASSVFKLEINYI